MTPATDPSDVTIQQAQDSFQRLVRLDARILCVGHGPVIGAAA